MNDERREELVTEISKTVSACERLVLTQGEGKNDTG